MVENQFPPQFTPTLIAKNASRCLVIAPTMASECDKLKEKISTGRKINPPGGYEHV